MDIRSTELEVFFAPLIPEGDDIHVTKFADHMTFGPVSHDLIVVHFIVFWSL